MPSNEDRRKIIQADPIVMRKKLFVVKPWDPMSGNNISTIKSISVWLKLSNIPLYCWTHLGINWLATRLGKFLCMDESTERLDRIGYTKCMVEVTA